MLGPRKSQPTKRRVCLDDFGCHIHRRDYLDSSFERPQARLNCLVCGDALKPSFYGSALGRKIALQPLVQGELGSRPILRLPSSFHLFQSHLLASNMTLGEYIGRWRKDVLGRWRVSWAGAPSICEITICAW